MNSRIAHLINHRLLTDRKKDLLSIINNPAGTSLCLAYGPTGVGKSRLNDALRKDLTDYFSKVIAHEADVIPFVSLAVPFQGASCFNWRDLYFRLLLELQEPHLDKKFKKQAFSEPCSIDPNRPRSLPKGQSVFDLRFAVEQAVRHRRTKVLIFDEAQHFNNVAGPERLMGQLETLKSLANETKTLIILIGTYQLRDIIAQVNGQLARRISLVHFCRYNLDKREHREDFIRVIKAFEEALSVPRPIQLWQSYEYLHAKCLGCVGILKEWLERAVGLALLEKESNLSISHLERTERDSSFLEQIQEEIRQGETRGTGLTGDGAAAIKPKAPMNRKRLVIDRNPSRDPVGLARV